MIKILKKAIIYIKCRKLGIGWKDYSINNKGEVDIDKKRKNKWKRFRKLFPDYCEKMRL